MAYVDLSEVVTAKFYDEEYGEWTKQSVPVEAVLDSVCDEYTALPYTELQPVRHGHWIYTPTSPLGFTCSECGKEMCRFNYCPHCGAKIDEVTQ